MMAAIFVPPAAHLISVIPSHSRIELRTALHSARSSSDMSASASLGSQVHTGVGFPSS